MPVRYTLILALAVLGALLPATPAGAQPPADIPVPPTGVGGPGLIATDGDWVVWSMTVQPGRFTRYINLYAASLAERRTITVAERLDFYNYTAPHQPGFAVDEGRLVFVDRRQGEDSLGQLVLYDLASGARRPISPGAAALPGLDGGFATWWEFGGEAGAISARLMSLTIDVPGAQPELLTERVVERDYLLTQSRTASSRIVWMEGRYERGEESPPCVRLFGMTLAGTQPQELADIGCIPNASPPPPTLTLEDSQLAFNLASGELVVLDLTTGARRVSGPHNNTTLASSGGFVFWTIAERGGAWGFDPATDSAFPVAPGTTTLGAGGGQVAWLVSTSGEYVLRTRPVAELLPTARRAADQVGDAAYFPETGHGLRGAFADYWRRNGGLPVFGYPLTEEFIQSQAPGGQGYTVQYFERQRFEFHPENAGTPYEVLLGRLGAEALAAQGRDYAALPRADATTPHYFAATGQAIAPEFWDYWRTHGLELGDPGLSEREALALWGYPLTPAAVETLPDGSARLVQWFERARFEYHPDNPEPYRVLLGLLAVDRVSAFGWPR